MTVHTYPALDRPCPLCGAKKGKPCTNFYGHERWTHASRIKASYVVPTRRRPARHKVPIPAETDGPQQVCPQDGV